jgi:hypothetical protein
LKLFAYPRLSERDFGLLRVSGGGLGNLLYPWARATVACRKSGLQRIWPTWPQVKLGPLLRREADLRFYLDLFCPSREDVTGARKLWMLATSRRVPEEAFSREPGSLPPGAIVEFTGMGGYYERILSDHALVLDALLSITRPSHLDGMKFDFGRAVSVHVRLGDFSQPTRAEHLDVLSGHANYRQPIEWYGAMIDAIRSRLQSQVPVWIFSDGTSAELGALLAMPRVKLITFGSGLADMLALSRAPVLVASGSTFSMWASYLGRMPVIWHPGQMRQRLYFDNPAAEIELAGEDSLPESFAEVLAKALGQFA